MTPGPVHWEWVERQTEDQIPAEWLSGSQGAAGNGFHRDNGRRQQVQQELGGAELTLRMGAKASGQPTRAPGLDRSGGADMGNTGGNYRPCQCSNRRRTGL